MPFTMPDILTAAFYKFVDLPDYKSLREPLLKRCEALGVKGPSCSPRRASTARSRAPENVLNVLTYLRRDPRLADLEHKESGASGFPFYRMKVRLKREIVTLGVPGVNPARMAGTYVNRRIGTSSSTIPTSYSSMCATITKLSWGRSRAR